MMRRTLRLKDLRAEHKLTQAELATRIGISKRTYQRYESSVRQPNADVLKALADTFGTTIDSLFTS